ncbi:MAG: SMC-Scp complex subunit ScpB [Clostridia bacterium]|nr:SMC-Scp complex subunit ScpB [Clostridia bacterium]
MKIDESYKLKDVLYSVLFCSGDALEKDFIAEKLEVSSKDIDKAIEEIKKDVSELSGVQIITFKNKVQLCSNAKYSEYISEVLNPIRERSLTKAALETLAIVAYKQPITKLEIEDIRGVSADYSIQVLSEQGMIEVVGRKDAVGKPLLFGTTDGFLKGFNLSDLSDLPDYESLLERIDVIETNDKDTLYNEFSISDNIDIPAELEVPDFLKGEDVKRVDGE